MLSLLVTLLSNPAVAGFLVEGAPHADKADAGDEAKEVKGAGYKGRVVRRFREGAGWEYVVRVEDIGTSGEAFDAQSAMGQASGRAYVVYDERGQRIELAQFAALDGCGHDLRTLQQLHVRGQ